MDAILVERNPTTTRHPKMDLTNGRSMEHFRRLGIADEIRSTETSATETIRSQYLAGCDGAYRTTRDFMAEGAERAGNRTGAGRATLSLAEVEVLCPITTDLQFLCQAINYHTHM